jgi:stage V sporulation protein B
MHPIQFAGHDQEGEQVQKRRNGRARTGTLTGCGWGCHNAGLVSQPVSAEGSSSLEPAATNSPEDVARGAGRGGLAVAGAKVWFILVGLVQQTLLPRLIGMDGYGAFATAQSIANIPNNLVTTSSIQGVSKAVAGAGPGLEDQAQRRVLVIHAALAPLLPGIFWAIAPFAAEFEHAPHLERPLRIFALVLLVYGLYTPLVGVLNGRRQFLKQASLDITFATLRTIGMLGAAWWLGHRLDGPTGAAIGLAVAAAAILPFAWAMAGLGRSGEGGPTVTAHLLVLLPIAAGQFFLNLLMQADTWLLRRFAHESGESLGLMGEALRTGADRLVGAYRAAQLFAFLPYQLLLSITFILFPMLARAHARREDDAVATYVRTGFRLAVVLMGLMVSCTSGLAYQLLRFAYPAEAAKLGSDALRLLALGQGTFALFGIEMTVLVSLSRELSSAILTCIASALVAALCWWLVPSAPFGASLLIRTATATSIALSSAAIAGAFLVYRAARSFAPAKTLVRTALAMAVAIGLGSRLPWMGRPFVIVEVLVVVAAYLAVAIASGELTRADTAMVSAVLRRKR